MSMHTYPHELENDMCFLFEQRAEHLFDLFSHTTNLGLPTATATVLILYFVFIYTFVL
jgi:hypothetical protein